MILIQTIWKKITQAKAKNKKKKISESEEETKEKTKEETENQEENEDEFNPTLAAMETEIKPKVLQTVFNLTKDYNKLIKYQKEKLQCVLNSKNFSQIKEKKL